MMRHHTYRFSGRPEDVGTPKKVTVKDVSKEALLLPKLVAWGLGILGTLMTTGMVGIITLVLSMQKDVAVLKAQISSVENRMVWQQSQSERYLAIQLKYLESVRQRH